MQHARASAAPAPRGQEFAPARRGMFSNSKVTTSTAVGEGAAAPPRRRRRATVAAPATCAAGASCVRAEDVAAIAEPRRRQRRHAAELAAAEDADGGAGRDALSAVGAVIRLTCRRGIIVLRSGFPPRPRSAARASASSALGDLRVAQRQHRRPPAAPALIAPGLADRQRARPGCRPASARSTAGCRGPSSAWLSTGTPNTGSGGQRGGHARQMRGTAGAGDDHLQAAVAGALGIVDRGARACGGRRRSAPRAATPSASSVSAAWRMVSQSDWLPMMMPTKRIACQRFAMSPRHPRRKAGIIGVGRPSAMINGRTDDR